MTRIVAQPLSSVQHCNPEGAASVETISVLKGTFYPFFRVNASADSAVGTSLAFVRTAGTKIVAHVKDQLTSATFV